MSFRMCSTPKCKKFDRSYTDDIKSIFSDAEDPTERWPPEFGVDISIEEFLHCLQEHGGLLRDNLPQCPHMDYVAAVECAVTATDMHEWIEGLESLRRSMCLRCMKGQRPEMNQALPRDCPHKSND